MIFEERNIEDLVAQCRLAEASAALALADTEGAPHSEKLRAMRAGVHALAGEDRLLARVVPPELLECRNAADIASYYEATNAQPDVYDHFAAAALLAWTPDAEGVYASLQRAHVGAVGERRQFLAVAARERLAHFALLFGNVARAGAAIEEAIALAVAERCSSWLLRCLAAAARLALDCGDAERAANLLARAHAEGPPAQDLALFAATGAALAVERGDGDALRAWTSPAVLDVALHCDRPEAIISAALATLIGSVPEPPDSAVTTALRRAILQTESAAIAPELCSISARYGDFDTARFAVETLAATLAPKGPYLAAHHLLGRAHLLFRSGDGAWIDCAGDAARAFNAMGLRRWTNEAMQLLVTQELSQDRRSRGRHDATLLTGREQQVAHLIRRGARNREVALALQISEHTVERHVSSILGRLGLRSRWQIGDSRKNNEH